MKVQKTFTFIISKNYGHPVSWNLPSWGVYLGGSLFVAIFGALLILTLLFFITYPYMLKIEHERDQLKKERDALQEQILSANMEAFESKEISLLRGLKTGGESSEINRREFTYSDSAEDYLPPVHISSATTKVNGKTVEVIFRISRQGDSGENRGGFLFAIFENQDHDPVQYIASPKVNLNEVGFPQTYKAGIRFSRVRQGVTYRRRISRQTLDDYFTHVTLFLFSLRGGLLVRDRYQLNDEIFRRDSDSDKTQNLLQS